MMKAFIPLNPKTPFLSAPTSSNKSNTTLFPTSVSTSPRRHRAFCKASIASSTRSQTSPHLANTLTPPSRPSSKTASKHSTSDPKRKTPVSHRTTARRSPTDTSTSRHDRSVSLPQNCRAQSEQRSERLRDKRRQFGWSYKGIADAALIDSLPDCQRPSRRWLVMMKKVEKKCESNSHALRTSFESSNSSNLSSHDRISSSSPPPLPHNIIQGCQPSDHESLTSSNIPTQRPPGTDLYELYKKQFVLLQLGSIGRANQFLQDELFGWYRIAGPNPMQLSLLRSPVSVDFPELSENIFQQISGFETDSLENAIRENRMFVADYSELRDLQPGAFPDGTPKTGRFTYAPRALFAVPKASDIRSSLLPIAIRCSQDASDPLFTASPTHTDAVSWLAAKNTVQVADAIVHETLYHFGRTHLLMELFVCATHRSLSDEHPLFRLLDAHFEGTAFINNTSLKTLVSPGGIIDHLVATDIEDIQRLAAHSLRGEFSFNESMPDTELAKRGLSGTNSPLNCPYRDDALQIWDCILEWMGCFVDAFYSKDADVVADFELQNWAQELVCKGRLQGFGEDDTGTIVSKQYLTRVLSMVLFTASVQHAAVNFPQSTMMNFAPAMPLCGYSEAPSTQMTFKSEAEFVQRMLPGLQAAERQMYAAEMLGVVRYTRLGEYGSKLDFAGRRVQRGLERFQRRLIYIGKRIDERNVREREMGLPEYNYLIPSNIPQSINV